MSPFVYIVRTEACFCCSLLLNTLFYFIYLFIYFLLYFTLQYCIGNTLKATSTNWEGFISMYSNLWGISWRSSQLSSLHSQGPQGLYLCSTYKLDKFFLETLMDPQFVFVLCPEFYFSSFVWVPCWVFTQPSTPLGGSPDSFFS